MVAPVAPTPTTAQASIGSAPVAGLASDTLVTLKQGLINYKRADDLQKMDPAAVGLLKEWAAQNTPAVVAWLAEIPDENKQREHAAEAMIALEVENEPAVAFTVANSINDDTVRGNRLDDILLVWAVKDPASASAALKSALVPDANRARLEIMIESIKSGTLTEDQRAKIAEKIQKMSN